MGKNVKSLSRSLWGEVKFTGEQINIGRLGGLDHVRGRIDKWKVKDGERMCSSWNRMMFSDLTI